MLGAAGRSEFFAREAADYLRALAGLLGDHPPEGDNFVRLARALRGAAMLAGPASYTRAASQLEQLAKLVRDGSLAWPQVVTPLVEAVARLEALARSAGTWSAPEDDQAAAVAESLHGLLTGATPVAAAPAASNDGGIRTFVSREAAGLAGALGEAAGTLAASDAPPVEALARVGRAMQSLRGLAGLGELAPLADLLDAIDSAVRELQRYPALPAGAPELCSTAAEAFSRMARQVAERGRPDPELPEAHRVADQLLAVLTGPGVVLIDDLDGGAPVLERRERRLAEPLDLSSLGERLRAGADQLRAAPGRAAARLQALVLLAVLRDAPGGLGRRPAGRFVARALDAIEAAVRHGQPSDLAGPLDRAGGMLAAEARADLTRLEEELEAVTFDGPDRRTLEVLEVDVAVVEIAELAPEAGPPSRDVPADRTLFERSLSRYSRLVREQAPAPPVAAHLEPEPVPIESLAPEQDVEPVPIEALAPEAESAVVDIAELAPEATPEAGEVETAPVPIEVLAPDEEPELVPIEALAPDEEPALVPIEALAPDAPEAPDTPVPIEDLAPGAGIDWEVVPIELLIYSGRGARERADHVRRELEASLRTATDELDRVEPLVRELLDLVPLALVDAD